MRNFLLVLFIQMGFVGWTTGQFVGNCSKGSDQVLTEYPSVVSLKNPLDRKESNINVLCGGVLLSTDTILTSAGCIWLDVVSGFGFSLMDNPVNKTFEVDFRVAISPYCTHGDGAEVVQVLGYHFMEDAYTGYPKDGNAVAVLELKENITSLTNSELPTLRTTPLPIGSIITMVGHGATNNQEASLKNQNYSRPFKKIKYQTISDEECNRLLKNLQSDKVLDGVTESCAVVQQIGEVNICNADDGNPLYDSDGNIAGIITWWPINQCERTRDKNFPIIFADVSKQKVQQFIDQSESESLYILPNITEGCGDDQSLQAAPWSVSIQFTSLYNPLAFHHICGGVLIDNGTKVVTVAQCLWDDFLPLPISSIIPQSGKKTTQFDLRDPNKGNPFEGNFLFPIFASLAPRCRHYNGIFPRVQLNDYYIHPLYNGNPQYGNNIAIIGLSEQFPPSQSFPNFEEFLKLSDDLGTSESAFSDVIFYSWGAEFREEAQEDEKGYFQNFFPAKEVSLELISDEQCAQTILLNNTNTEFDSASELCTDQPSDENFTNICSYDKGGPLVGRLTETNQLVLLGFKSQLQDRQCLDGPGSYEVFTDIIKMKDFILGVLETERERSPSPNITSEAQVEEGSNNNKNKVIIIVIVVCACVLLILVTALMTWRIISRNNKVHQKKLISAR